jgi:hypothetical protein
VAEAVRDFLGLLARVGRERESAVLVREGKAIAILNPVSTAAITCGELAERWPKLKSCPRTKPLRSPTTLRRPGPTCRRSSLRSHRRM